MPGTVKIADVKPASSASIISDFQAWMGGVQARMESVLSRLLPPAQAAPAKLHEAMRYATLEGGKRVRPLLAFAAGELAAAPAERLEIAAAAVEMIHAYSLVHDDLPCMDDDVLRRGKPTVHVEYDEATALLVGDALQSLAFQTMSDHRIADRPETQLEMVKLLAGAAGSRGMAGGQQIDLDSTGRALSLPELELMHIHKTGALIRAAVLLGALCGKELSPDEKGRLDKYAKTIGLAFQVVDDVLDAEASSATLGKTAGKDSKQGKPTYVSLLGAARAKDMAQQLRGEALAALEGFGARARRLGELADFIVLRKF
jgi:farnesyl diphosphate synthase